MIVDDKAIRRNTPSASIRGRIAHALEFTTNRHVPGPGKYDVRNNKYRTTCYSFGNPPSRDTRSLENKRNDVPGPGTYTAKDKFGSDAKSFSLLGKFSKIKNQMESNPGPGSYNADRYKKKNPPSYTLKGAVSDDPIMREKKSTPAPGIYNPKDDFVKKQTPNISFGPRPPKPPKSDAKKDGPGPGSYALPSTLNSSKGAVMVGSRSESRIPRQESPGPGAYSNGLSSTFLKTNKNILIVGKPKNTDKAKVVNSPGPGAYEIDKHVFYQDSKKISFGHGDRFKQPALPNNKDMPGPGTYTYSNDIFKPKGKENKIFKIFIDFGTRTPFWGGNDNETVRLGHIHHNF